MITIKGPIIYILVIVLLGGLLVVYASVNKYRNYEKALINEGKRTIKTQEQRETPIPNKPLDADFFRESKLGPTILAYLSCEDFDCEETFQTVVKAGSDAVFPLIQLLQHGAPPEVAAKLPGDAQTLVRIRVINALGGLADSQALTPIVATLQDSHPLVRAAAAGALGQIGGHEAVTSLLPLLQDPDPLVRETTAQALGRLKRPEALPALRSAATDESKPHVWQAIETAIQTIEQQR